jgi:hypothetical protein
MGVGMRLALAVASKLSLLEAVTDSESLSCKTTDPEVCLPKLGSLALRQRALLKLSWNHQRASDGNEKQVNKKGA